jgi:microcystin degradation protein MlrC
MSEEPVLFGGFAHESNTFATDSTTRTDFSVHEGSEIPETFRGTNSVAGGVCATADREDLDVAWTYLARAEPGPVLSSDAFEHHAGRLVAAVETHADSVDGVVLSLHGAMATDTLDDAEGELLGRVRDVLGPDVPVAVTLDLHANVSEAMVERADALVAYRTYPHVDVGETGERATRLLAEVMRGDLDPTTRIERPPVLPMGPLQNTRDGPMAEVMARARSLESRPNVRLINVLPGYHMADSPVMGFSVPVLADGDPAAAREAARDLAAFVWERRESFVADLPGPEEGVRRARELVAEGATADGPVVLADTGDNPGGGTAADGTTVLRAMLDQGGTNAGFAIVRDPAVVAACIEAGVGERVTVDLGGKTDDLHGEPIRGLEGYVAAIADGRVENTGPMLTGVIREFGRTVRLQCGREESVAVLVTENRVQPYDAEVFRHVGVAPERLDVVCVKSNNHYRADYEPMASHVLPLDTIGLRPPDPRTPTFERIRRPVFPIDAMADGDYADW